jgi:hypothetical protein
METIALPLFLVVLGSISHEMGHWVLGKIFGGGAHIDEWHLCIPSRTNFNTPKEMSDFHTRLVGGWPYIFVPITFVGLWIHNIPLFIFGLSGALPISASDLTAAQYPDVWKKLTAGESVSEEDYEDSTNLLAPVLG